MKKLLFSFSLLFLISAESFCQSIPNPGFQNWTIDIWDNYNPDNWETSNGDFQVSKITMSNGLHNGYALHSFNFWGSGQSSAWAQCKFPVTNHPEILNAIVQTEYNTSDTATISVIVFANGIAVDSGLWLNTNLNPIPSWTLVSIPISQFSLNADSVMIKINGGNWAGTSLYVDELYFTATGIDEAEANINWIVYPNPFSEQAKLKLGRQLDENYTFILFNEMGQVIQKEAANHVSEFVIERKNLSSGIYFFQLISKNKIFASGKLNVE